MKSKNSLSGSQLRTYERIFQHPVSHNLGWHDVLGMFRQLGTVEVEENGNMKVTRNGQFTILHAPRTKDVPNAEDVLALRHFLTLTEVPLMPKEDQNHWLVVIDHHQARIFRSPMSGTVPDSLLPHEPTEFFRHAHHSRDFSRGKERPDPNSFFEPLAQELKHAGQILILGTGTGLSSEMEQFTGWLRQHHPETSRRVLGALAVDETHLTEGQLLNTARRFYAARAKGPSSELLSGAAAG